MLCFISSTDKICIKIIQTYTLIDEIQKIMSLKTLPCSYIYELFQLLFTICSVTFDLRKIESPNQCQNFGFFLLFPMNSMRLTYDIRNIRQTRAEHHNVKQKLNKLKKAVLKLFKENKSKFCFSRILDTVNTYNLSLQT